MFPGIVKGRHPGAERREEQFNGGRTVKRTGLAGVLAVALGVAGQVAAQDRPLSADFEEVYRVGGVNAPEWAFFAGFEPTGFDGAGNLYVLDTQAGQVVIIDPEGGLVRTVGRKGEGPGEFKLPGRIWVWRDGSFVVQDLGHTAYQVFGATGELERFVRMGEGGPMAMIGGMRLMVRPDPAGGALIAQGMPSVMGAMSGIIEEIAEITGESVELPEPGVDDRGLERLDLTGEVVSATPMLQAWRVAREDTQEQLGIEDLLRDPSSLVGTMDDILYYEPPFLWDVFQDGSIAYYDSTAYAIKIIGPEGTVVDVLRRPFSPVPITDLIRQETIDWAMRQFEEASDNPAMADLDNPLMGGMREALRKQAAERDFYLEVPVVTGLRATWDGAVWVKRIGEQPWDGKGPIDVFGADREYVGTLAGEDLEMPVDFGPDGLVVYWEFDELGVPTIMVKRLPAEVR